MALAPEIASGSGSAVGEGRGAHVDAPELRLFVMGLFFIFGGKMIWSLGLVMFAGQSLGARLGATVVLTRGKKVIRPMIVIVSICISVKMLLDMY